MRVCLTAGVTTERVRAGAEMWNAAASPMLCRQASDGCVDDLAALFFSEDSRIVF